MWTAPWRDVPSHHANHNMVYCATPYITAYNNVVCHPEFHGSTPQPSLWPITSRDERQPTKVLIDCRVGHWPRPSRPVIHVQLVYHVPPAASAPVEWMAWSDWLMSALSVRLGVRLVCASVCPVIGDAMPSRLPSPSRLVANQRSM